MFGWPPQHGGGNVGFHAAHHGRFRCCGIEMAEMGSQICTRLSKKKKRISLGSV